MVNLLATSYQYSYAYANNSNSELLPSNDGEEGP